MMNLATALLLASVLLSPRAASAPDAAAAGFRKVSDHFYYLASRTEAANTGAVITTEGVLIINPPPEPEMSAFLNALKAATTRPVRWVLSTDYQQARSGEIQAFLKQGAAIISSKELDRLASAAPAGDPAQTTAPAQERPNPRFVFGGQLHLYPAGIEVRIIAVKQKARTAGDVFVFVPSEKVLEVGDLFTPGSYPTIDAGPGEGSAAGWIDGLKQMIDAVPLLKAAIPQPKQEPPVPPGQEKPLEETVIVISSHGEPANLQQLKDMLATAVKLRTETSRAVAAGRSREDFLKSLSPEVFGTNSNLEAFAGQLFDELSKK